MFKDFTTTTYKGEYKSKILTDEMIKNFLYKVLKDDIIIIKEKDRYILKITTYKED